MRIDALHTMLYSGGNLEKAFKEEDIPKLDGYKSSNFIHPRLNWLNNLSKRLGDKSFFNGSVRINGHNVYHRSGKAVGEPHWHASGEINWGWMDDNGFDSGYNSGIEAFDALKKWVSEKSEEGDELATLFIDEWEANYGKW